MLDTLSMLYPTFKPRLKYLKAEKAGEDATSETDEAGDAEGNAAAETDAVAAGDDLEVRYEDGESALASEDK